MTAQEYLAGLKRLAAAATEGPWWATRDLKFPDVFSGIGLSDDVRVVSEARLPSDAMFISEARTAVPRLVAALEAVLEVFPQSDDPCPPRTCVHVDCEVLNAIETVLGEQK